MSRDATSPRSVRGALVRFFETEGWKYEEVPGLPLFRSMMVGRSMRWPIAAQWNTTDDQLVFYSICPIPVPREKISIAAEYISRVNFGLPVGNFEIDFDDGEIRFRTSADFEDIDVSLEMVHHLFYINVAAMDRYIAGIQDVLVGATPRDALQKLEGD